MNDLILNWNIFSNCFLFSGMTCLKLACSFFSTGILLGHSMVEVLPFRIFSLHFSLKNQIEYFSSKLYFVQKINLLRIYTTSFNSTQFVDLFSFCRDL